MTSPFELEWAGLTLMLVIAASAGVVRGFTGFGAGLVMVPGLTLLLGPTLAVPTVVLLETAASIQLVPGSVRRARWRTVAPLGVAACLTIPVGSIALATLDPTLIQRAISSIILVLVAVLWTGWRYRGDPTLPVTSATGLTSGLLTGMAGIGGPPVILFFISGPNAAAHVRASLICYFAITQLFALGAFLAGGLLTAAVLGRALILAPAFLGAAHLGARLFSRVDEHWFRHVVLAGLAVIAAAGLFA